MSCRPPDTDPLRTLNQTPSPWASHPRNDSLWARLRGGWGGHRVVETLSAEVSTRHNQDVETVLGETDPESSSVSSTSMRLLSGIFCLEHVKQQLMQSHRIQIQST